MMLLVREKPHSEESQNGVRAQVVEDLVGYAARLTWLPSSLLRDSFRLIMLLYQAG